MRKFFGAGLPAVASAMLLAGCVSVSAPSPFTDFSADTARSVGSSYDLRLISTDETVCKVYKLTERPGGAVFYALSVTGGRAGRGGADAASMSVARVGDLAGSVVISRENADELAAFIDLVASAYTDGPRGETDAVLYDFAVVRDCVRSEMAVDSITSSGSKKDDTVTRRMKEFRDEEELVRVQLRSEEGGDVIVLAVAGYPENVGLDGLLSLKYALQEVRPAPAPEPEAETEEDAVRQSPDAGGES